MTPAVAVVAAIALAAVAPVRCAPGNRVRFTISTVLASEFGDGKPIRAAGAYAGTIGARPLGFPP